MLIFQWFFSSVASRGAHGTSGFLPQDLVFGFISSGLAHNREHSKAAMSFPELEKYLSILEDKNLANHFYGKQVREVT